MKHYDTVIIGAGMSGLAAGIRLAHFGKQVAIFEKHWLWGGLNSFYKKAGREFDVGLHAMTNFSRKGTPGPLNSVLKQLRLNRDDLQLCEQVRSEVRFPSASLQFSNELSLLESEIAQAFPGEIDGFRKLCRAVREYDDSTLSPSAVSSKKVIAEYLDSDLLRRMILCPLQFYGSATPNDMSWHQFVIMFKSIFFEGFCRPQGGVRRLLSQLKHSYLERGGELFLKMAVEQIDSQDNSVALTLSTGETVTAETVFSSVGFVETQKLLRKTETLDDVGQMSFIESIYCLSKSTRSFAEPRTILFYSLSDEFEYCLPPTLVDMSSGIICCPENFEGEEPFSEGVVRITHIANHHEWHQTKQNSAEKYVQAKRSFLPKQMSLLSHLGMNIENDVVYTDIFTPLSIERFTSHKNGAVYGSPKKFYNGETTEKRVFICGTDQGYLGIVGSLLSGIMMANRHGLRVA